MRQEITNVAGMARAASANSKVDWMKIREIVGARLKLQNIAAIVYSIAKGSIAAYYPEANMWVPLDDIDEKSGTPSYKSVPVHVVRALTPP